MKDIAKLLLLFLSIAAWLGCERNDDEPLQPTRPISRLYVSTLDYQTNPDAARYENIFVVDPADSEDAFSQISIAYTSDAKGGAGILFSPDIRRVMHASVNAIRGSDADTSVQVITVSPETGQLGGAGAGGSTGRVVDGVLSDIKGMAYHPFTENLFLINSAANSATIYVYNRPISINRPQKPRFTIPLGTDFRPWSTLIRDLGNTQNDRNSITYMSAVGSTGGVSGIVGFKDLTNRLLNVRADDSVINNVTPDFILTVPNSNSLQGMSYSPTLDLLVMTDYSEAAGGRILFFNNFSSHTETGMLTPDRVISGASTQLQTPVDVEIDGREGAKYIYVADRAAQRVFRFMITDQGNVAPNSELHIQRGGRTYTPSGISLDARGTLIAEEEG